MNNDFLDASKNKISKETENVSSSAKSKLSKDDNKPDTNINETKFDLGYITGYNRKPNPNYNPEDPSSRRFLDETYNDTSTIDDFSIISQPSIAESNFKFNNYNDFEDPTYLTFDIVMFLDQRPLWDDTVSYGVTRFLKRYKGVSEKYVWRENLLKEFRNIAKTLFYTSDDNYGSTTLQDKKSYYIQSVQLPDDVKKPITKYRTDKLTITLNEDVKMFAEYISELYNNLSYDYIFKRKAIPENCLRFDMALVISDVRKFKIPFNDDNRSVSESSNSNNTSKTNVLNETLNRSNVSRQVYIFRDCNFDFSSSKNIGNDIKNTYNEISPLTFNIFYKSVERTLFADLFKLTKGGTGQVIDLPTHNLKPIDSYYRNKHEEILYNRKLYTKESSSYDTSKERLSQNNINTNESFNFINDKTRKYLNDYKDRTLNELRQQRGKLIDGLFSKITDELQIQAISPDNVYDPNFNKLSLENFVKGLGGQVFNDIEASIISRGNSLLNDVENAILGENSKIYGKASKKINDITKFKF